MKTSGDRRKFGQVERRQARCEIVRGKAFKAGADHLRRAQGSSEREVNQNTEADEGDCDHGKQPGGFAPGLRDKVSRIDRDHGIALQFIAEENLPHNLSTRIEQGPVQAREEFWRVVLVRWRSAAKTLQRVAIPRAIGDAEARTHERYRDILKVGKLAEMAIPPVDAVLLDLQIPGDDVDDPAGIGAGRPVGFEQNIGRGRGETACRQHDDAKREPELEISHS